MNRRIIVLDEDPETTRATVEVLESHGYQVLTPPDSNAALRQVVSEQPWVVIAGETLPGGENGLYFVDRVAHALPSLPPPGFIVLQNLSQGGERLSAFRATPVDMYLAKPSHRLELLSFVVRLSNSIEAQRESDTDAN